MLNSFGSKNSTNFYQLLDELNGFSQPFESKLDLKSEKTEKADKLEKPRSSNKKSKIDKEKSKDQIKDKDEVETEIGKDEKSENSIIEENGKNDSVEDAKVNETVSKNNINEHNEHNDNNDSNDSNDNSNNNKGKPLVESPYIYPKVLAIPLSRRPLFPEFYRPVSITNPEVIKAVRALIKKKIPYIGLFLYKDDNKDGDVIYSKDEVHDIGVFCQITTSFSSKDPKTDEEILTMVVFPHSRINIDNLSPPKSKDEISKENTERWDLVTNEVESELKTEGKDLDNELVKNEKEERILKKYDEEIDENPIYFLNKYEISIGDITKLEDEEYDKTSPKIIALTSEILKTFKEFAQSNSQFKEQLSSLSLHSKTENSFDQSALIADFCGAVCSGKSDELQQVLNNLNIEERLEQALYLLKKEASIVELQQKINERVESKVHKRQREYILQEQLKVIKNELGVEDGRQKLIDLYNERVSKLSLPDHVKKIYDDEITKFSTLESNMSDYNVTRNYLDWITQLPFGKFTKESFNIKNARKILDEDHFGLKDVKDRIIEFIAVAKLFGAVDGKIICLVGPPGVGKTSIGKSIARSLNRNFFRFSVGGLSDVYEIKGHRRTYVGALPGRLIQALKKTQSSNPLILIDEIDKIGRSHTQGDPSAALLELLDPEQNSEFLDQYMDFPIDLSKVLFVCTANSLDTIPGPLLDRMEVIQLSGYIAEEKFSIAKNYLIPSSKKSSGLENVDVNLTDDTIKEVIKYYTRSNGVRDLKKQIEKIYRKAAFKVVSEIDQDEIIDIEENNAESKDETAVEANIDNSKPLENKESVLLEETKIEKLEVPKDFKLEIKESDLIDYIGPKIFSNERLYELTPPGVIMGLAWTQMGGAALFVEATGEKLIGETKATQTGIRSTGQLGEVMTESVAIAFSVAKSFVKNDYFETHRINLHCPEGAIKKDGPSAGSTITTALISLALNKPLPPISMTGEISLTGKILKIGGVREKLIASRANNIFEIFFPYENKGDFDILDDYLKEGMKVHFVKEYKETFDILFGDVPNEPVVKAEKETEKAGEAVVEK